MAKSSYHAAATANRAPKQDKYLQLRLLIQRLTTADKFRSEYRKIWHRLKRLGVKVSEKIVQLIMREGGWCPIRKFTRKYSSYQGENSHGPDNLLHIPDPATYAGDMALSCYFTTHADQRGLTHDFHADAPNQKWVTDLTEFACTDGKVYLSPIIDRYDGYPISWRAGTSPSADLAVDALTDALATLVPGQCPIVHSDRGMHYRTDKWRAALIGTDARGEDIRRVIPSMSRKATSGDNAAMEGFFGTLKQELIHSQPEKGGWTCLEMMAELEDYRDWYIHDRLNQALDYRTLAEHRELAPAA